MFKVGVVWSISDFAADRTNVFRSSVDKLVTSFQKAASSRRVGCSFVFPSLNEPFVAGRASQKQILEQVAADCDAVLAMPLTGGTENNLKLLKDLRKPLVLYGTPLNNSLAASIELREHFRDFLIPTKLTHSDTHVIDHVEHLVKNQELLHHFLNLKLGLFGEISPWLINEDCKYPYVTVGLQQLKERFSQISNTEGLSAMKHIISQGTCIKDNIQQRDWEITGKIYLAIKQFAEELQLDGFTIGCFDLIGAIRGTPCIPLAVFNAFSESGKLSAACEGEIGTLLAIILIRRFLKCSSFMANLVSYTESSLLIAHCTAPLDAGKPYTIRSHFESQSGVAVTVEMDKGVGALFKIRNRKVIMTAVDVDRQEYSEDCCRTQVRVRCNNPLKFVDTTLGNHHLLIMKDVTDVAKLFTVLGFDVTVI